MSSATIPQNPYHQRLSTVLTKNIHQKNLKVGYLTIQIDKPNKSYMLTLVSH